MQTMLASAVFVLAALCAALMGYAIQRGATCTVAAVDELLTQRRAQRLAALLEASLWVAGGLLAARAAGVPVALPAGHASGGWTLLGGLLLGAGAFVNGACVFGAIARFGTGEWAYALTPVGFYAGCLSLPWLFAPPAAPLPGDAAPLLHLPPAAQTALLALFAVFVGGRLVRAGWRARTDRPAALAARVWAPHAATLVIGLAFLALLLLAGAWTYTELLAELARGMAGSVPARVALALALLAGAVWGGWTAGRLRARRPPPAALLRCFAGGTLMGWGSLLIPGGNDGLILVGMPLGWPYAWLAIAAMGVAIALAQLATPRLGALVTFRSRTAAARRRFLESSRR